jgi:hypothetical protein
VTPNQALQAASAASHRADAGPPKNEAEDAERMKVALQAEGWIPVSLGTLQTAVRQTWRLPETDTEPGPITRGLWSHLQRSWE